MNLKSFLILTLTYIVLILSLIDRVEPRKILRSTTASQSGLSTTLVTNHGVTTSVKTHEISIGTTNSETVSPTSKNTETSTRKSLSTINLTNDYHTGKSAT